MAGDDKAPQTPEEQLRWKEQTDSNLGFVQLDMMKIPAKVTILSDVTGQDRVDQLRALASGLEQEAQRLEKARDPLASSDDFNQKAGILELSWVTEDVVARVTIKAVASVASQASHMALIGDSLRRYARELEAQIKSAGEPAGKPPQGVTIR